MIVDPDWAEKLLENREDEFVKKPFVESYKEIYLQSPLYNLLKVSYQ
ncbi:NADH-dependent flavin oxidoreductase, partial [Enterococcus lactis]